MLIYAIMKNNSTSISIICAHGYLKYTLMPYSVETMHKLLCHRLDQGNMYTLG